MLKYQDGTGQKAQNETSQLCHSGHVHHLSTGYHQFFEIQINTKKLKKRPDTRETYSFLLLILNTSFCSSCTKRKNSLMSALIIVDISMILIRSTLMMFFCNFVMMWLILLLRLLCFHKKRKENEGKYFPQYSVYTQPVQLFVFVWFLCLHGVKILALFQSKGPQKEKRMAKNNIMYTIDIISMLHFFLSPTVNSIRLCL